MVPVWVERDGPVDEVCNKWRLAGVERSLGMGRRGRTEVEVLGSEQLEREIHRFGNARVVRTPQLASNEDLAPGDSRVPNPLPDLGLVAIAPSLSPNDQLSSSSNWWEKDTRRQCAGNRT